MRILLIEDERKVADFVRQGLEEEGHTVQWAVTGERGLARALAESFDVILLDVRLPDGSGLDVCRRLRLHDPALPILMLTALDAVDDRVRGLRAGADDYLPKPFAFEELIARIEALDRRAHAHAEPAPHPEGAPELDPLARVASCGGEILDLTQKEFDLLAYFLARPEQALSRDEIHRDVWGLHFDRGTNLIDVYVGYLRRKLEAARCRAQIQTLRGVGYRYVPSVPVAEAPSV